MVKKAKRKYTRRKNKNIENMEFHAAGEGKSSDLLNNKEVNQESLPVNRASERASIFSSTGTRILVRNLSDKDLIDNHSKLTTDIYQMRRNLESLENLSYQMYREKEFRGL